MRRWFRRARLTSLYLSGSGVSPANTAAGAAADETAATITPVVLDPLRLSASYRIRQEDHVNKLAMLEDSLRLDLTGRDGGITG